MENTYWNWIKNRTVQVQTIYEYETKKKTISNLAASSMDIIMSAEIGVRFLFRD